MGYFVVSCTPECLKLLNLACRPEIPILRQIFLNSLHVGKIHSFPPDLESVMVQYTPELHNTRVCPEDLEENFRFEYVGEGEPAENIDLSSSADPKRIPLFFCSVECVQGRMHVLDLAPDIKNLEQCVRGFGVGDCKSLGTMGKLLFATSHLRLDKRL